MGFDVSGKSPKGKRGEYFARSVWGWHPLWNLCAEIAPELTEKVEYPHSNDGAGLDAEDSAALAVALKAACDSGLAAKLVAERNEALVTMPDEPCRICAGTGRRKKPPTVGAGDQPCNGCDSKGRVRPFATHYEVSAEDVREFADFLTDCGGFEIW